MKYILILLLMPLFGNTDCKNKNTKKDVVEEKNSNLNTFPVVSAALPACVDSIITKAGKDQPPVKAEKVELYSWDGKQVYLITWQCCDFFNEVYDNNCKRICAPSGGITGRGEGNCPDFVKNAKLIKQILPVPLKQ